MGLAFAGCASMRHRSRESAGTWLTTAALQIAGMMLLAVFPLALLVAMLYVPKARRRVLQVKLAAFLIEPAPS